MRPISETLTDWLSRGGTEIGEIHLERTGSGFTLEHRDDRNRPGLSVVAGDCAARELAHYDDAGNFRPLKTAPNLRHGWRLQVPDFAGLRRALDYFYPAMLGVWHSHRQGTLQAVPLRATLGRQTGMYRVTQKITDEQAATMIEGFCSGCLKRRLWTISGVANETGPEADSLAFPLLCQEACNLLVAEARKVVKKPEPAS